MHIAHVTLVVRDYDEAIAWYTEKLGFVLVEDTTLAAEKRFVRIAPPGAHETQLFLHTDDFERDYRRMKAHGVHFVEEPRHETYGKVVVFEDLYGNRWDLVERRP